MQKLDSTTFDILQGWIKGKCPTVEEQEILIARELEDRVRAKAFGINQDNCQQLIEARSQLFNSVSKIIFEWCEDHNIKKSNSETLHLLWTFWLPLAINLVEMRQELGRTPIQGILGSQGTGKSSLTEILDLSLKCLGYTTARISLDDLYKTHEERQQLREVDPRFIWRGPPGTHDIDLGIDVITQCIQKSSTEKILIPRFDKSAYKGSGDRSEPETISAADIVLFDGWFVGVRPIPETKLECQSYPILTPQDIQFAKDCNQKLHDYVSLWEKIDRLLILYPEDYHICKQWRKEAEHNMIAQGKTGMSDLEIEEFVDYFWRSLHPDLFIKPLITRTDLVDLVVEIKSDRSYGRIYKPEAEQ